MTAAVPWQPKSRELESLRYGVIHGTAAERKFAEIVGVPWSCAARRGGMQSLEKEPTRATLDVQSTRHGAPSVAQV